MALTLTPLPAIPHIHTGDDLPTLILASLSQAKLTLQDGDILAIAQKIVSKAEGRWVRLDEVEPSNRAIEIAHHTHKDPRLVELILRESTAVSRQAPHVLIVRHRLGFVSANAGIDRSNVPQEQGAETVLLLPQNPDHTAAQLRHVLQQATGASIGLIITDSHGRPFRLGTVGVAIGAAGLPALWDKRGQPDLYGYKLRHTAIGWADEIASAASLLMGQAAEGTPVIHLRGLHWQAEHGRASHLLRPPAQDLYA